MIPPTGRLSSLTARFCGNSHRHRYPLVVGALRAPALVRPGAKTGHLEDGFTGAKTDGTACRPERQEYRAIAVAITDTPTVS